MKQQCPAKINLFLEVTGKRKSGYHTLATLFAKINLYDVLDMEVVGGDRPVLEIIDELGCPGGDDLAPLSAGRDNLVLRAARAFYREFRVGVGVKIALTKRIPIGAGLGGGSSDAAGTLLGLAKLLGIKLTAAKKKKILDIGVKLGADVPFFLKEENFCRATGIGDRLKPVKIQKSLPYMVLVWPGFPSPTGPVFSALASCRRSVVLRRLSQLKRLIHRLGRGRPIEEWAGLLFNRLEQAELPIMAEIERARRILESAGVKGVRMSGSGSSVFGFISSHVEGAQVIRRLKAYPWKVYLTSCLG